MKILGLTSVFLGLPGVFAHLASPGTVQLSERPSLQAHPKQQPTPHLVSSPRNKTCVVGSGAEDAAPAILEAAEACNNGGVVVFPANESYTIGTALNLTFLKSVDFDIQGHITFSSDVDYWDANGFYLTFQNASTYWMFGGDDVNIYGGGTLDGNGQVWYDAYAENIYILRPILLAIVGLNGGSVSNLKMRYSPQYYNIIINSTDVIYDNIDISGGSVSENEAKNTDGWDTYRSDLITIQNSVINNGDDCVSFKPNSTNIIVQNLICNGSHGISVGSLGQYNGTYDIVENVYVYNISMSNASDGARIKVWPGAPAELSGDLQGGGGLGHVRNITYDYFYNQNNDYAIELTQCYGQKNRTLCDMYPSNLTISDIHFKNFWGTTSDKYDPQVGTLICSSPEVCSSIYAENIAVSSPSGDDVYYTCSNVDESLLDIPCRSE